MNWRGYTDAKDKIFSTLVYLFAIVRFLPFGDFLLREFPPLRQLLYLLLSPVLWIYDSLPLSDFIVFLVLYFAVVRNPRISDFIRFNTIQTILIGILLYLLGLVFQFIFPGLGGGLLVETLSNTIFLGGLAVCFYSMVQSALGQYAEIPTISDAAYSQIR
ncbi:MAG: hypothetical protein GDA44_07520 [Prochloron sp. SP5CPC1]|nr:hypothetical protein [Candidatus Paraprochloron terpiosi SP5CPC1]